MEKGAAEKKNKGSALRTVLLILLALELIVAVLLSTRLVRAGDGRKNSISLTEGGEGTTAIAAAVTVTPQPVETPSDDDFTARDEEKIWETETEVEIFHLRYDDNGDGIFTTESGGEDKVFAPGTGSEYAFTLSNTGKTPLTYTLSFESWMEIREAGKEDETENREDEEEPAFVPVEVRLLRGDGEYLLGGEEEWLPAEELNSAKDEGDLDQGESSDYVFEWRWPFERSDEEHGVAFFDAEDTALGNDAAAGKDISLIIRILTSAEIEEPEPVDAEPTPEIVGPVEEKKEEEDGGGRAWSLFNLICTVLSVLIGLYELAIFLRGRRENKDAEEIAIHETEVYGTRVKRRRHKAWDLAPAIAAPIVFILTEDMRLPMIIFDRWSPLMAVILAVSVTVGLLTKVRRWKKMLEEAQEELSETVSAT